MFRFANLGGGDAKLIAALGLLVGPAGLLIILFGMAIRQSITERADEATESWGARRIVFEPGGFDLDDDGVQESSLTIDCETYGDPAKPTLDANLANAPEGDIVLGMYDADSVPESLPGQPMGYDRGPAFEPSPRDDANAVLVRLRRTGETDLTGGTSAEPLTYLWSRGSLMDLGLKGRGVSVRGESIAQMVPAVAVGTAVNSDLPTAINAAIELADVMAGRFTDVVLRRPENPFQIGSRMVGDPPEDGVGYLPIVSSVTVGDSSEYHVVGFMLASVQGNDVTPMALSEMGHAPPPLAIPDVGPSRIQSGLPAELILPPPSDAAKQRETRFVEAEIDPEIPLSLVLGRPKILRLADAPVRIYVPDEETIRTEIIDQDTGRELAVTGIQPGTTTLMLWFADNDAPSGQSVVSYLVRVYEDPILARPIGDLEAELNSKFPNSFVELDEIADRLIVRGQAPDAIEMGHILQVLSGARGVRAGVTRPADPVNPVTMATKFDFIGAVDPLTAEERAAQRRRIIDPIALAQAGIINQMKIVGEQQVMLKVTVAEVNRSAARSIGLNFAVDNDSGLTVFRSLTGNLLNTGSQSGANVLASLDMGQVRLAIEALRRMNLSRTLAEPNLVAMNGQPADFQAGGQFPIPILSSGGAGGNNLQGVSFVPFGVQLQFTPLIQDRDVIRLQMNAEVSTRDESLGANIGGGIGGGTQVAGLNSRNFSTTVQLRSGQTIAVAGLLQTNYGASTDRVPFWGDLPIIGATGGVNRSSSGEQELVILVTPHLVAPVDLCEAPALPGSDVHEPTDIEFFIANRLESRRTRDHRSSVRTDYARQKRAEHCCPEQFMVGEVGPTDRCSPRPAAAPHRAVPRMPGGSKFQVGAETVSPETSDANRFNATPLFSPTANASLSELIQGASHE